MSEFLLDTNVASAFFDRQNKYFEQASSFFEAQYKPRIYISAVTWGEIRYGYRVHTKVDPSRKQAIESQMKQFPVLDINKHTSEPYSMIRALLFDRFGKRDKKTGKIRGKQPEDLLDKTTGRSLGIDERDLFIVATAVQHNLEFMTGDRMTRIREIVKELYLDFVFWDWRAGAKS